MVLSGLLFPKKEHEASVGRVVRLSGGEASDVIEGASVRQRDVGRHRAELLGLGQIHT